MIVSWASRRVEIVWSSRNDKTLRTDGLKCWGREKTPIVPICNGQQCIQQNSGFKEHTVSLVLSEMNPIQNNRFSLERIPQMYNFYPSFCNGRLDTEQSGVTMFSFLENSWHSGYTKYPCEQSGAAILFLLSLEQHGWNAIGCPLKSKM